jgi:hypothetical protein
VSVEARGSIYIADQSVQPGLNIANGPPATFILSGISLIQNSNILIDLEGPSTLGADPTAPFENTILTGILTSVPNGAMTLQALGSVNLSVGVYLDNSGQNTSVWNLTQGIVPAQLNLVSLQSDVTVGDVNSMASVFITYPSPTGTVNLLARGSVDMQKGFVLSDADPSIMPTIANIADKLSPFTIPVVAASSNPRVLTNNKATTLQSNDGLVVEELSIGGANFLLSQDPTYLVLLGDNFDQLVRDVGLSGIISVDPATEAARHGCLSVNGTCQPLHFGDTDPARIIAVTGDVTQSATTNGNFGVTVDVSKQVEISAGRDVKNLALLGQNNNATDVTTIIAGRDVIYTAQPPVTSPNQDVWFEFEPNAIAVGGPGNVLIESGRNTDLGISNGIQSFGNALNPRLANQGAGITIQVGLGDAMLNYSNFITEFVNPATDATNPLAEILTETDAQTGAVIATGAAAFANFQNLPPVAQHIAANELFFGLLRDSGREHNGTDPSLSAYQRAFAAITALVPKTSATGDFLGGLSAVRTRDGGDITILAPTGQIQVGQVAPPASFPGYSLAGDPTWALGFGIVTERGGNIDLYSKGDVSVNQSRIFTLQGGDLIIMSADGDIDAGKGAKTVQSVQPPTVSIDPYGNITITPYGPASGSGIATLRSLPDVPVGSADLIAPKGVVNAGDAGIRVSGDLNIAAVAVLNASNIQVSGKVTGIPVVTAPDIGALTSAANNAAAVTKSTEAPTDASSSKEHASVIIVEVLGYGGAPDTPPPEEKKPKLEQHSYNPADPVKIVGYGRLTDADVQGLTEEERAKVSRP